jgi:ATP-binding cassette, subfamily C (CFTR/MRP), member 1
LEYLRLPQEAPRNRAGDPPSGTATATATATGGGGGGGGSGGGGGGAAAAWPCGGSIVFENLCVRYRSGLPLALDGFSARIAARERVGVVGRTGAGKSSLMLALFRLVDAESGSVHIDGRELSSLGLDAARSCISIIPQEPTLFRGTVAHNLDPFALSSDEEKAAAIARARLPREMLSLEVEKGGVNLSSGERQLLCFARALLQPRPILVLDEATSNLDAASDAAMQALLRNDLRSCTLLTIAHRLLTVVDYDTIMVMGGGKLLEHDSPAALLAEGGGQGVLRGLATALGEAASDELRGKAEEAAREREGRNGR